MTTAGTAEPRRLVILAPNWLGDAVMALPAIADVRRALPAATIAVAARPPIAPLFALVEGVDDVVTIPPPWREGVRALRAREFDVAILLPNSLRAALLARQARVAGRWGFDTDLRKPLLTRAVRRVRGLHQSAYYQHLVHGLGFENLASEPRFAVPASVRAAAVATLNSQGRAAGARLVAIAPGAAFGGAKRWLPSSFAALVNALAGDGVQTVVVGAAADRSSADLVLDDVDASHRQRLPPIDLVGRTDLAALAAVLMECRTLVTNDSGAMHVAAAAGVPVTAVFGPTNDRETRPLGSQHAIIVSGAWCRPCMLRECPLDHQCMRNISASTVFASARRTL